MSVAKVSAQPMVNDIGNLVAVITEFTAAQGMTVVHAHGSVVAQPRTRWWRPGRPFSGLRAHWRCSCPGHLGDLGALNDDRGGMLGTDGVLDPQLVAPGPKRPEHGSGRGDSRPLPLPHPGVA